MLRLAFRELIGRRLASGLALAGLCTACHPDLFFSHRRAARQGQPATGRQALILWLE